MTGRRRPSRPPRTPGATQRPRGFEDVAELSDDEVQRRVAVEGGVSAKPPIERSAPSGRPPRRPARSGARDALLLVGLVIVGLVAVAVLLPKGPLTASSTNPPDGTQAAIASDVPSGTAAAPSATPLPTAEPLPSPDPGVPSAAPTAVPTTPVVTQAPVPTPTLRPGQTPPPTPRPTPTPKPTVKPTAGPTPTAPPPGMATLAVTVVLIRDDGGNAAIGSFTVNVTSAGTATPSSFAATTTTTNVTITAGVAYSVGSTGPSGYAATLSADCSSATGGLPPTGSVQACKVIRNDVKPRLTVVTAVDGGPASPSDWTVTVSGTDVSLSGFAGDASGVAVRLDANAPFDVNQSNAGATDYSVFTTGPCSGSGLNEGADVICTFTFTYVPPPTDPVAPLAGALLFAGVLPRSRRWRTKQAT